MAEYAGIDISRWNTLIDYPTLKKAKIDGKTVKFAMLRFSYGKSRDTLFDAHYKGCRDAGIYVGAYHWLRAKNVTEARDEAQWLVQELRSYELDYPAALDFEDSELLSLGLPKERYTAIVNAFMTVLTKANYYVLLYTNPNCLENYLQISVRRKYDLWLAHWTDKPRDYGQKMWQYAALGSPEEVEKGYATAAGKVDGVTGPVDVNISYVGYARKIREMGKNRPAARYLVRGTKTVDSTSLAQTQGQLKALGFEVTVTDA